jgi:ribosome-binding factor A
MAERRRTFRVSERIRELIASEVLRMADPRFGLVTITSVVTSADLRHAKVYWMVSGGKERVPQVTDAFTHAEGLFRKLLARELGTRFVPELRFYYDDTIDTVHTVEELLSRISAENEARNGEVDADEGMEEEASPVEAASDSMQGSIQGESAKTGHSKMGRSKSEPHK